MLEDIKPISRAPRRRAGDVEVPIKVVKSLPREIPYEPIEEQPRSPRYALWYIAGGLVIAFLFSLSFLFEHANVDITPKSLPVAFDSTSTFTAQKDSTADDTIVYSQMTLSGDDTISLPATVTKTDSQSATGSVVLYNAYQKTAYKLVKNTRLSTADGKIYHLDNAVTIPGYTGSGTSLVPGSVSVTVTAAAPGEDYNIAPTDFTVPGLAGTAQATTIYGRSATPLSGGTSGTVYTIPQDAASAAMGTLQDKLKASLLAKAKVQVPDGYILYDGATLFTTDPTVQVPYSKTQQVPLALHGTLTAYILKQDTLVKAIAETAVSQYGGEPVTIPDLESLTLVPNAALAPATDTAFTFTFSGTANIVWTVDPTAVQTLLASRKKNEFETLISGMVGVNRAQVTIKPFWKQSFPDDVSRIHVTIEKST